MTRAHPDWLHAYLSGAGYHVPERVVTNDELAGLMDTSDEWIRARTGIVTRRFAAEGEGVTEVVARGKIKPGDLVIFAAFGSGFTWASALVKW